MGRQRRQVLPGGRGCGGDAMSGAAARATSSAQKAVLLMFSVEYKRGEGEGRDGKREYRKGHTYAHTPAFC